MPLKRAAGPRAITGFQISADRELRALAVTTTTRSPMLPDIPALSETLPGYEASTWFGIGVPKSTPTEVIDKLNREINTALADPNMKKRLTDLTAALLAGSPEDFTKFIADEIENGPRW